MIWIGLTGGIATGKSTVTHFLRQQGFNVADADFFAKKALEPQSPLLETVLQHFGPKVLNQQGQMDRVLLGQIIFSNSAEKLWLENLIHPYVQNEIQKLKQSWTAQGCKFAFYDVPLLFEKNLDSQFDKILAIICPRSEQIQRLQKRNNFSIAEAELRIQNQVTDEERKKRASYIIENNGNLEDLETKTLEFLKTLK
jgi:dephospho-CoA kinase